MTDEERLLITREIASTIDFPSVYMGGPSQSAMIKARHIVDSLEKAKRLVASKCGHDTWKSYRLHGAFCPTCGLRTIKAED